MPTPCGPNSDCQERGDTFACSCLQGYIGVPPSCRPECTINPECPPHLACMQQKCRNPCNGICGVNAQCSVVNHHASCSCLENYSGDPFSQCSPIINTGEYAARTATKTFIISSCMTLISSSRCLLSFIFLSVILLCVRQVSTKCQLSLLFCRLLICPVR